MTLFPARGLFRTAPHGAYIAQGAIVTGDVSLGQDVGIWFVARLAMYDDLRGWDTDPYLGPSEFYNNFGHFDVRLDVPAGWVSVWVPSANGRLSYSDSLTVEEGEDRDLGTLVVAREAVLTGRVLGGGYSLWLLNRMAFGNMKTPLASDLTRREVWLLAPLAFLAMLLFTVEAALGVLIRAETEDERPRLVVGGRTDAGDPGGNAPALTPALQAWLREMTQSFPAESAANPWVFSCLTARTLLAGGQLNQIRMSKSL